MATDPKRVLDVGQCNADHAAIQRLLVSQFGVEVGRALTADQAFEMLRQGDYDLVLVNRILDLDRTEGIEVIRQITGEATLARIPVMLVSNLPDAQQAAMAAGAVRGFGKSALHDPATVALLQTYLAPTALA
jgi:CheY-like chemotaxis protein